MLWELPQRRGLGFFSHSSQQRKNEVWAQERLVEVERLILVEWNIWNLRANWGKNGQRRVKMDVGKGKWWGSERGYPRGFLGRGRRYTWREWIELLPSMEMRSTNPRSQWATRLGRSSPLILKKYDEINDASGFREGVHISSVLLQRGGGHYE